MKASVHHLSEPNILHPSKLIIDREERESPNSYALLTKTAFPNRGQEKGAALASPCTNSANKLREDG